MKNIRFFSIVGIILSVLILNNSIFAQSWIQSVTPTQNSINVSKNFVINIVFNRDMQASSLNSSNIYIRGVYKTKVQANFSYNTSNKTLTITPLNSNFSAGEKIFVNFSTNIKDNNGTNMSNSFSFQFTLATSGGLGSFTQDNSAILSGTYPYKIKAGDFDNDGFVDLAVANVTGNTVTIFKNNNGNFGLWKTINVEHPDDIALGDLNNDGLLDIAVSVQFQNSIYMYINAGNGNFNLGSIVSTSGLTDPYGICLCDVDGDCNLDLIVSFWGSDRLAVYKNNSLNFQLIGSYNIGIRPRPINFADINNDGAYDLLVGIDWAPATIAVLLNNGNGTFSSLSYLNVQDRPYSIAANDFNNDNKIDFAVSNFYANTVSVAYNQGGNVFNTIFLMTGGEGAVSLADVDINADGKMDLLLSNANSSVISIYKNNGSGFFTSSIINNNFGGASGLAAADFDNDGDIDFATANSTTNSISIFRNDNSIGINPINNIVPDKYILKQNYPNPFNPKTTLSFDIKKQGLVTLNIYNTLGNLVSNVVQENLLPGSYQIGFDASQLSSGIYYYKILVNDFSDTKKMIVIK